MARLTPSTDNLPNFINNQLIDHPFVWVKVKSDFFETSVKEYTSGSGIKYAYSYTGSLKSDTANYTYSSYANSIIFIEDSNEIWAGGQFFGLSIETVSTINANFNALQTAYNWVKNFNGTYVNSISTTAGNGSGIVSGITITPSTEGTPKSYTISATYIATNATGNHSNTSIVTNVEIGSGKIDITYGSINVELNGNPENEDVSKPIVGIRSSSDNVGITYKRGNISYNYVITDPNPDNPISLPTYLASMNETLNTRINDIIGSGLEFKGKITTVPTNVEKTGCVYIWNGDENVYNKGDMLISYWDNNTYTNFAVVEHNIDNTAINNAVSVSNSAPSLGTNTTSTIGSVAGTDLTAKLGYASTSNGGAILVSGVATTNPKITAQTSNTGAKYYGVYTTSDHKAYVNIPWTDTQITLSGGTGGQIVTSISQSGKNVTVTTGSSYVGASGSTTSTNVSSGNNAYIHIGAASIGIKGNNDITVTYTSGGNIELSYSHGLSTVTTGTTTNHDTVASSNFNKAVSGISVSAHQITPTYTIIASYTYIENQIQRAYDHANSVATEAAALKWVVI